MNNLFENLQGFVQTNIDLAKIEIQDKLELTLKKGVSTLLIALLIFLSTLFILLAIAFLFSKLFGNYFWGFGSVAVILIIITTIIYFTLFRKKE